MNTTRKKEKLKKFAQSLSGEFYSDQLMRALYATDASVYQEMPLAVALPKTESDIQRLIQFAYTEEIPLIPRAAGTSLAGQCVGKGIVVDTSKYFTKILELNVAEGWVRIQPGVIRDELNKYLAPQQLFFGPNTSTANRCMLGGMVGNNSSGSTSVKYGVTRDKVMEVKGFLSDGSPVHFKPLDKDAFYEQALSPGLEGQIYQHLIESLSNESLVDEIHRQYPKSTIHRRNTGYALDSLLKMQPFENKGEPLNLSKLIAGSEGTLMFMTELKLRLDPIPPKEEILFCPHFESMNQAMEAVLLIMEEAPYACELMDKIILDCTQGNPKQQKNRFFVEDDPQAILIVELRSSEPKILEAQVQRLEDKLRNNHLGYAYPTVSPPHTQAVWELRKAGLGLLSNIEGDAKPVACIEDTAVALEDLPAYIRDFDQLIKSFKQEAVYYAHAGAGELHLRPILDLKKSEGVEQFYEITKATAELVKSYKGSLSGEHGDGRVRAGFIPMMYGAKIYQFFKELKSTWDPQNIFNPGKIVNSAPMTESLRYEPDRKEPEIETISSFQKEGGILRAAEKCNGSGDCRKLSGAGGTMCPSYRATRNEKDSTRARANALRYFLTQDKQPNPFDHKELKEVLDLCLSCKACASECPSSVDMAAMKAEFLHQYYRTNGAPLSAKAFSSIGQVNAMASNFPKMYNFLLQNTFVGGLVKQVLNVAHQRKIPQINHSLVKWYKKNYFNKKPSNSRGRVYFFFDEFTNYLDVAAGKAAIELLFLLGYEVAYIPHAESGRAQISKGFLKKAQTLAIHNVKAFTGKIDEKTPLIGIEPSAILSFQDEYPRLVSSSIEPEARELGQNTLLLESFLYKEIQKGQIEQEQFTQKEALIAFHGHCHQKALSEPDHTVWMLSLPQNYHVEGIPSGCCGMAGSFGYEKDHYQVSMDIGEMVLFPEVRRYPPDTIIAANGTSCREQIIDGTGRMAMHPAQILRNALKE